MLIDGITVLNSFNADYSNKLCSLFFLGFFGILFIIAALFIIKEYYLSLGGWALGLFVFAAGVFCFYGSIILSRDYIDKEKTEIHYQVTIDDSVSFNEFYDKYEILEKEGDIYTIKERENNND